MVYKTNKLIWSLKTAHDRSCGNSYFNYDAGFHL